MRLLRLLLPRLAPGLALGAGALAMIGASAIGWGMAGCGTAHPRDPLDAGPPPVTDAGRPPDAGDGGGLPEVDGGPPVIEGPITYHEHIRPILAEHCLACHGAVGVGPVTLATYSQVQSIGTRVRDATRSRAMPPFLANPTDCVSWSNDRRLSALEIELIDRWVRDGLLEGDAAIPEPPARTLPTLPRVDLTLRTPTYSLSGSEDTQGRCFPIETGLSSATSLVGFDVAAGNETRVHHVTLYAPEDAAALAEARALDSAASGAGYICARAGVRATPVAFWTPHSGATVYPEGTGIPLAAGSTLIAHVHYYLRRGTGSTDSSTLSLMLSAGVAPARILRVAPTSFSLEPRMASLTVEHTQGVSLSGTSEGRLWAVFPLLHQIGTTLSLDLDAGGSERCLVSIPRWKYEWPLAYFTDEDVRIRDGDQLSLRCGYNSLSRGSATASGEGPTDEACAAYLYLTP